MKENYGGMYTKEFGFPGPSDILIGDFGKIRNETSNDEMKNFPSMVVRHGTPTLRLSWSEPVRQGLIFLSSDLSSTTTFQCRFLDPVEVHWPVLSTNVQVLDRIEVTLYQGFRKTSNEEILARYLSHYVYLEESRNRVRSETKQDVTEIKKYALIIFICLLSTAILIGWAK